MSRRVRGQRQEAYDPSRLLALAPALLTVIFLGASLPVHADRAVGGEIHVDTLWTLAHSPYRVAEDVIICEGVSLTIEPGVVVAFERDRQLQVNGALIARGTASQPIRFGSNQANKEPGDWGRIVFTTSSIDALFDEQGAYLGGSILQYCVVEYAGGGPGVRGAIETSDAAPFIDHCAVRNNQATGIYGRGTPDSPAIISHNTVSDNLTNNRGAGIAVWHGLVEGNLVTGNASIGDYNGGGGIYAWHSTVRGNQVTHNHAGGWNGQGGGILAEYSVIAENIVSYNRTSGMYGECGGICASDSTLTGNQVSLNSSEGLKGSTGGGVRLFGEVTFNDNRLTFNTADDCGGLFLLDGDGVGANNIIAGNQGSPEGEGLCVGRSKLTLTHTTIANSGSGVYIDSGSTVWMTNTIIASHTVGIDVGFGCTATMHSTLWSGNVVNWNGSGTLDHSRDHTGPAAFRAPSLGDYHLQPSSAAVDSGVDAGVVLDIDGQPRPYGAGHDLGADEYWPLHHAYLPLVWRIGP